MDRRLALAAGVAGTALAGWIAWGLYTSVTTEHVPYETVDEFDGVQLRRYPTTVTVETTAPEERTAFRRLVGYLKGENRPDEEVSMTAPVETDGDGEGATEELEAGSEEVSMTAPVETDEGADGVHMSFYLPPEYDYDSAPTPTDPEVRLVERPARTLAVRSFSWWTSDRRVERQTAKLTSALSETEVTMVGDPFLLRYDDPRTPPFMRTNEVAVEVRRSRSG